MTALFLILLSAAVHAVVNILTKRADDKYAMRLLIGVFSAAIVGPFLVFVPLPSGHAIWLLVATAFVHALYELLLVKSYESAAFSDDICTWAFRLTVRVLQYLSEHLRRPEHLDIYTKLIVIPSK